MNLRIFTLLLACITCLSSCTAADFYVSPNGSDAGPGTIEHPFKTLSGAQAKVRAASFRGRDAINVHVRAGTYYLAEPFQLDARDSGTAAAPILYTAYAGEKVVISGGVKLTPKWTRMEGGIYRTRVEPGLLFDQLFLDGQRQVLARFPNYDPNESPYNGASPDAFSKSRAATWQNPAGGFIHAMHRHHWGGYHYRITGKTSDGEVIYEGGWQNNRQMGMHPKHRMVENIREELDKPGEWFLDSKTNLLYFIPVNASALPTALVEAARLKHLVEFTGSQKRPVHHVFLRGFIFRHAGRTFMDTREPLLRSDWTIYRGGAIVFQNAEHCGLQDCELDQLGGNGIFVNKYNRHINISGCHLHHCGASGICFVGDPKSVRSPKFEYGQTNDYVEIDREKGPMGPEFPADCIVDDCLIHNMSVVEKQATGVQISMSNRITIRHCSIYDMGRAGINISEGTFGGHLIEHCDVFNTVRETGDHGSFNSWGRDRFWHLKNAPSSELPALSKLDTDPTIIRNSRWRCDHGWDVDLDDGSSHYEIYNNLFLQGGLKLREGFYRNVYNNIAINNTLHPHVWYDNSMDRVTRNIWMGAYRPAGGMPKGKWGAEVDHNFFTTQAAKQKYQNHGCDQHSIVGDPLFLNPSIGDYRVAPESLALTTGFKNFPMDRFGVRSNRLKAIAKTPKLPVPSTSSESVTPRRPKNKDHVLWLGMTLRPLTGEQFSAFGVSREQGGLVVIRVNPNVPSSFQIKDVIQAVNKQPVRDVMGFLKQVTSLDGKPVHVSFVRGQKTRSEVINIYPALIVETAKTAARLTQLPVPKNQQLRLFATPPTNNQPLAVLSDQQLAPNYGPVFANGVQNGCYKTDLGVLSPITQLTSWSYGMNARGTQKLMLYGSVAAKDPGWDPAAYEPIGTISAKGSPQQFTAAALRASDNQTLGSYRWILWQTQPITDVSGGENTAFQELAIEVASPR
jgi:hypothetical protein